jgi:hypothetical protein
MDMFSIYLQLPVDVDVGGSESQSKVLSGIPDLLLESYQIALFLKPGKSGNSPRPILMGGLVRCQFALYKII